MPLIKSASRPAVGRNIAEMEAAGHPHDQAVAASLNNARKYGAKFAFGGFTTPWTERAAARELMHEGGLNSVVPGRTDKLPITVGGGAYVLPADHVAALGQGNSMAGTNILNRMFKTGPYGTSLGGLKSARPNIPRLGLKPMSATPPKFARGGEGKPTPIIAAGGEFVIPADKVREIGGGDINKGHKILDHWVLSVRKKHIATLRGLKPPKRD